MKVGLFPGQGIAAEVVLDVLNRHQDWVQEAGSVLGYDLSVELARAVQTTDAVPPTNLMQPAIFTASSALFRSVREVERFDYLAGHSLGEYAALVAAEAMSFEDALRVLMARSEAMDVVARTSPGGMGAVLRLSFEEASRLADAAGATIANDNAPGQVVASGSHEALEALGRSAEAAGGRFVKLSIAGPYHSDAVSVATPILADALMDVDIRKPKVPVVSNVTARPFEGPSDIRLLLVQNLILGVRWRESLEWLWAEGVRDHLDVGPGGVVGKLARQVFASCRQMPERVTAGAEGGR